MSHICEANSLLTRPAHSEVALFVMAGLMQRTTKDIELKPKTIIAPVPSAKSK